ncbi:MAG: hypothetical protein QXD43_05930 [Candidatus Aenigmatarchaeota archaeon]
MQKNEIIDYINFILERCKKYDCKECKSICKRCFNDSRIKNFDLMGCPQANYLVKVCEDFKEKNGYDSINSTLIGLTGYSKVEGILNNGIPNKDGIRGKLNELKILLGEEPIEKEVEVSLHDLKINPTRISRKAINLVNF